MEEVRLERRGAVALITLDRPERLNAMTPGMHRAYRGLLADAEADAAIGAVVVTGAGRGFCAGADSGAVEAVAGSAAGVPGGRGSSREGDGDGDARPGYGTHPDFDRPFAYHLGLTKPVVAAINGPAAGLGLVLACCCDVRFAAAGAKLTTAFGPLGLPAEYGLAWLLPRLIGGARATELLLSSRVLLAEEAATLGLVHRVLPPDELVDAAIAWGLDVADRCAPGAVAATKRQVHTGWTQSLGDAYDEAQRLAGEAIAGPGFAEGVAARRERRPPRWR